MESGGLPMHLILPGILLVAGDKSGTSEKRFYKMLIKKADERFDRHLTG